MTPSEPRERPYKRPFDLAVLVLAHVLLMPVWLALWAVIPLLIWLEDRGPVFYRQARAGKGGRVFKVLKFRTMVQGAERLGPSWTLDGDSRVTRVGRFLRRTGLDELPQTLSIWKGDMSLVGPRALPIKEQRWLETRIPGFAGRLAVRPGLTGLAQVYNRTDEAHAKLRYDLEYIERMSPWLDTKLLLLSVRNTLLARWDRRDGKSPATVADEGGGAESRSRHLAKGNVSDRESPL
jgi:lipopolysaccharide/colanic/teichoic acid biosynthesis glycosyltransferase